MEDIKWLPGALVIIGGLVTMFVLTLQFFDTPTRSSELLSSLQNLFLAPFLMLLTLCMIVIGLGALMIWKPMTGTAVTTGFIGMFLLMLNWVGFIFIFGGSVLALFMCKKPGKPLL